MAEVTKSITQKIKELESTINWAWVGFIAGTLSLVITLRNLYKYLEEIKKSKS